MSKITDAPSRFEAILFDRIRQSDHFKAYQDAFCSATGLPLRIVSADTENWCLGDESVNRSPFCEALNECQVACDACVETNRRLMEEAEVRGPTSCHCFAGLSATAVPVRLGASIIGFLKTGQVFQRPPDEHQFKAILELLGRRSLSNAQVVMLRRAWLQTRTVEPKRYDSMPKRNKKQNYLGRFYHADYFCHENGVGCKIETCTGCDHKNASVCE